MLITTQQKFDSMLSSIEGCRALAIDTEFIRESTYYPKLCLLQLATDNEEFIVDPFKVPSIQEFASILSDSRTVKIFHAGFQDREILYNSCGVVPSPVFDTQVAAPLLGLPQHAGYASVVNAFCGVKLKKSDTLTDWARRPLSNSQMRYSLEDVRYLIPMYDTICQKLDEAGRLHWLDEDFEKMQDPHQFDRHDSELWHKVKKANALPRRQLAHASNLAIWREKIARKRDIPRKWVLSDEILVEICKREPKTPEDLYKIRGTREKLTQNMAREIVRLIDLGNKSDPSTWPSIAGGHKAAPGVGAIADVLMGIVKLRAKENHVAPQVLAVHDDLLKLAGGRRENLDLLSGWRYELVGRELVNFLDGKESMRIENGKLCIETVQATSGSLVG